MQLPYPFTLDRKAQTKLAGDIYHAPFLALTTSSKIRFLSYGNDSHNNRDDNDVWNNMCKSRYNNVYCWKCHVIYTSSNE